MIDNLDDFFKLTPDRIKQAIEVAGDAFQDDPVAMYSFPDEKERKEKLKHSFKMIYEYGMRNGATYATSDNLEGIIVWLPPGKVYPSTWTMMRHGGFYAMRKIGLKFKVMRRSIAIFNYEEVRHKALVPYEHWYLQNIAVKPKEQRKGYGGRLISVMLDRIDSEGLAIYLETNNEKNLSFYKSYGFEIIDNVIIPGTPVPLWCMLRKPR
ncbi:MAG: GNAT family N-acetyltransferase [Candidatus Thorarchaeota archaeon]